LGAVGQGTAERHLDGTPAELRSGRVWLRTWQPDDAGALVGVCGDPLICAFTTIPRVYSEAAALDWIERQRQAWLDGTSVVMAVLTEADGPPIGTVWLYDFDDGPPRRASVGGWARQELRGRGLFSEALHGLFAWAASELAVEELKFCFEPTNPAARGVAGNIGTEPLGWTVGARSGNPTMLEHHTVRLTP